MIEFRQFKHVVALEKFRNYRLAAESVFISQPALSLSIKAAEENLGQKLFDKIDKKIVPTAYGEIVAAMGAKILQDLDNLKREIDQISGIESGHLRISLSPFIHYSIGEKLVERFLKEYPAINLDLVLGTWTNRIEMLKSKAVDLDVDIFVVDPERKYFKEPEIETIEVTAPDLVYYVRKGHPLSELPTVSYKEITNFNWGGEGGSLYYQTWLLEATGLDLEKINLKGLRKFYSLDYHTILSAVLHSDIVSAGSKSFFGSDELNNQISILTVDWKVPHPAPVASILFLKNRSKTQLMEIAVSMVKDLLLEEATKNT